MENMRILHDNDADLSVLNGKTIAVIGYGSQGRAQSLCMRDSGLNVIVGVRPGKSFDAAVQDGFKVLSVAQAAEEADIIHILLPDEMHGPVYRHALFNLKPGQFRFGEGDCCPVCERIFSKNLGVVHQVLTHRETVVKIGEIVRKVASNIDELRKYQASKPA